MNNYLSICCLILLLSFNASCQEEQVSERTTPPVKTEAIPEKEKASPEARGQDIPKADPYFNGTQVIDSPKGPETIVRRIIQDRKGHFWLASWDGIIRYDGKTFTNFTNKEDLMRYRVFSMVEDRKGNIWFGTIGAGVYKYDGKTFQQYTTKDGLVNDDVTCIIEDKAGNIWFGTGEGISVFDHQTFTNFYIYDGLASATPKSDSKNHMDEVNRIVEDRNGNFWIAMRGETYFFDPSLSEIANPKLVAVGPLEDRNFRNVRGMIEDRKGNIWFGGDDGLWQYDGKSYTKFSDNFTGYILEDKAGHIWTSSETDSKAFWALKRYNANPDPLNLLNSMIVKEAKNMYFDIMEDQEGNIWWGALDGIYKYDGQSVAAF